jgi:hypothetical protein
VAIVNVPVRAAPVLAAMLKPTAPFPVPAAPDVTESQGALLTAVHAHAAVAVTFTVPVPAAAPGLWLVGEIEYVHAGGVPAPAACDTAKVLFATEILPVRAAPVFAATVNVTVPLPRPVGEDVTVIHDALLDALQSQAPCVCTVREPEPPVAGKLWLPGEIDALQLGADADCVRVARCPATTIAAVRSGPGLGGTVMLTAPVPVPLVGDNVIHPWSAAAVHVQSGSLVPTVTLDSPPLVAMVCVRGLSV